MYNLGEAVGYIRFDMSNFLSDAERAKNATKSIEDEFDKLGDSCKVVQDIIVKSFAAIGAAIVAGLGKAVDVGSQFEASMSQVAATMGMTADEVANSSADFEKLSNAAKEMGETTKFSASQAADALNYLALAGYDAEQSISILPTVLNLAAAGGMDLARASDMITDAASALGLELEDMSLFADKMAKAAQSSNTSVEQLGDAILTIGGTARNLKGGINELNTALGILANNGIKGSEGGTALRQVILNLTAPSEKAAKAIDELGLKVKDAAGDVRPLNEIFRDLDEILQSKGITGSADKIEALSSIFDARQLKSATALLNNYGESWDRLYDKIDNAEGAASQMAETMQTNLKGALTILGSTAEGFGITIYESIEGSFKKATEEAIKQLSNLNQAFKSSEMQQSLQKISDAISKAIVELSKFLSNVIPKIVSGLADLIDNFDKISAILAGLVTTIGLASAGMLAFKIQTDLVTQSLIAQKLATLAANAALLANPYTLVAVGVGVLVTALIGLENEQRKEYEQVDKLNAKYREVQEEIESRADAYNKQKEKIDEINNAHDEEINRINELVSVIQKNVDETGKIISNTELVKDAIDELNSILPVNIQYQENQILNYESLVLGSQAYCEQLKQQAIIESNIEKYKSAATAYDEAAKKQDELTKNLEEAQARFEKVRKAKEEYGVDISEFQAEADAMGMFVGDYIANLYDSVEESYAVAAKAWADNKTLMMQAESDMLEAQEAMNHANVEMLKASNELLGQQVKNGQEITGVFRSESEARIRIAEDEAEKLKEINKKSYEERMALTSGGEIIAAEEELEAALEELEIQYNTGVIATEKEYHDKRLELLDNFHGEWTKKTSQWLKQETDYQEKYTDNLIKEEERKRKEAEQAREEAERVRKEAERQRQQELKEAEQVAKEKERLFKEETDAKIKEIDRRKERDESYTDEQYLADLINLRDTLDKESELWQQLDDKIFKYQKQVTENNKKELEQQLKDQYQAYQDKLEFDDSYTKEMYVADLQAYVETLDKESDLYKEIIKEINRVNKQIKDENEKLADESFTSWEKGFNGLKSEAEKAYNEIQNKQKSLENTLNNQIELYETKTKKVKNLTTGLWEDVEVKKTGTSYLKEQLKDLEKYQDKLEKLKQRGISDDLMQKIMGMDEQSQKEYVDALSKMSDTSLKQYDDAYSALINKNKEFSEKYYADEVEAFKTEWGEKIQNYIDTLPEDARKAAQEIVNEFVKGISETDADTSEFGNIFIKMLGSFPDDIAKGKIFENYGEKSVDELVQEISDTAPAVYDCMQTLGENAGNKFVEYFGQAISKIDKLFNFNIPDYVLNANNANLYGVNQPNLNIQQTPKNELTKDDIKEAIKEASPDGNIILNINGDSFARISRKQLNLLSQRGGNLALNV